MKRGLVAAALSLFFACQPAEERRYELRGDVVSVDGAGRTVEVEHEEISHGITSVTCGRLRGAKATWRVTYDAGWPKGSSSLSTTTSRWRPIGTTVPSGNVTLPVAVDSDKIDAKLHNGVLTVRIPKSERAQRRRIEVKS